MKINKCPTHGLLKDDDMYHYSYIDRGKLRTKAQCKECRKTYDKCHRGVIDEMPPMFDTFLKVSNKIVALRS